MTTKVIGSTEPSFSDMSDEQLVQQFVQGDSRAFNSLYDRYVKAVYKRVRYVIPGMDVEDITQEVFLAALGSLSSFRGEAKFSTWLRTLTNNKVAEYYRKRSRKKETEQVDLSHADREKSHDNTSTLDNNIFIQNALFGLNKTYREVILLRFADELKFNEIANKLGKNLEATKSLYRRAMSALREELEGNNDQNPK